MKRKMPSALLLICYCVPWVFLGMLGDYYLHAMWPYFLMIAIPGVLTGICARWCLHWNPVVGNILSTAISWLTIHAVATEKWNYFFKAFPCTIRLFQFASVSFAVQLIVWWIIRFYSTDKT